MAEILTSVASGAHSVDRWFDRFVAPPALLLLGFGAFYDVGLANTGLGVLLLALLVLAPIHARRLAHDRLVWLTLAFIAWGLLAAWLHARAQPEWNYTIWSAAGDWLLTPLLGSLVVAFWLARHRRLIPWLLALMVAGFLVRIGQDASIAQLGRLMQGHGRATFGDAATNFGIWALVNVLVLLSLLPGIMSSPSRSVRVLALLTWVGAIIVSVGGLVLSQARGSWLAAIIVVPLMLWLLLRRRRRMRHPVAPAAVITIVMVVCLATVWLAFGRVLERRFDDHRETIARIVSGELENLPSDSPGFRIRMYAAGIEAWWQRPLVGHGPGATEIVLEQSEDEGIRRFSDVHNAYLVILIEFGGIGLVVLAGFVVTAIRTARRALQDGWLTDAHVDLLITILVTLSLTQLFEHSLHSMRGPFVIAIFCGLALSARFVPGQSHRPPRTD